MFRGHGARPLESRGRRARGYSLCCIATSPPRALPIDFERPLHAVTTSTVNRNRFTNGDGYRAALLGGLRDLLEFIRIDVLQDTADS